MQQYLAFNIYKPDNTQETDKYHYNLCKKLRDMNKDIYDERLE